MTKFEKDLKRLSKKLLRALDRECNRQKGCYVCQYSEDGFTADGCDICIQRRAISENLNELLKRT